MENNLLKVRIFGGFSLEFNDKEVVLDRNAVSKTMQLLQLILLHSQDGGISKAALIEALYGRAEVENKNGSLNNTIFRLRKQLQKAGLPESNYIQINAGMCSWDENVPVSVDVCQFRKLIQNGKKEKREETRIKIWKKAWELYKGELLPDMIGETQKTQAAGNSIFTAWKNCVRDCKIRNVTKIYIRFHIGQQRYILLITGRYGKLTV